MKIFKKVALHIAMLAVLILVFNIPVKTLQGIEGKVFIRKIPLYVKLCGFLYRDHQYKYLSRRITDNIEGDIDKVMAMYNWTIANIRRCPKGFLNFDDHIWNIVVRGYGSGDQKADVFTTLASYAGYEAYWAKLDTDTVREKIILSFVKIGDDWHIFDVHEKKYFISSEDLMQPTPYGPTYSEYLNSMDKAKFEKGMQRPRNQKIIPRIVNEFKKFLVKIERKSKKGIIDVKNR